MRSAKDLSKAKMKIALTLSEQQAGDTHREADARREQRSHALVSLRRQMGKR